jgi:hypothetical protein
VIFNTFAPNPKGRVLKISKLNFVFNIFPFEGVGGEKILKIYRTTMMQDISHTGKTLNFSKKRVPQ